MSVPTLTGTVLRARSGFYTVTTASGTFECQLRGRLKRDRQSTDLVVIGDEVTFQPLNADTGLIESVAPRRSRFSRRQPGPRGAWKEDLLVANIDQLVVVFACADPPPHQRMIDRFLVVAEQNEIGAVVVANKIDLCGLDAARAAFGLYEDIGYRVIYASARTGRGVEAVREQLASRVSVIAGPSGVGKSTLLNAIHPGLHLATGAVSESLHKGRHTTSSAELHALDGPMGGHVADTPGLREIGLWHVTPEQMAWGFLEFRPYLGACRFANCSHGPEPGCAVRAAVASGAISAARHDSYRRLVESP